ncbi:GNAT family N-acetyltransferase [Aureimonas phyllosphaerae]|uniref:RimJ/RimL family protein N-acetyltransferase n=1 Tax=Aureimonas phyllosphaerae TaxID=1166078 RepID=A0A7W6BXL5_9HYPH|nr:GNAT family N-acetyltransferase [Aureimonas phyllosphaerae]MBB3936595.1 RimJ/RimL family protein N-acetyltransferase [Aureimonas phyllosphaerae]MBB3960541.1 RimJ/RimL family protein N-acetyltransferase [Aureimonas phyllosphaerae]SFF24363.1 Protein N-acetyltransferase, RimJ/RimL family [Aureimonas phyllosphaerae]
MDGLQTERLTLRRWREADRPIFHALNSDPVIMRFFDKRLSREEADATMDRWNAGLDDNGVSFLAAERRRDGAVIGTIGLAPITEDAYRFAPTVQIGWRLVPDAEGQGYASEGARACLAHGFDVLRLPDIVAQCVVENRSSEKVMLRLGMTLRGTFDHPKVSTATHPHLVRHSLYGLTAEDWRETQHGSASRPG